MPVFGESFGGFYAEAVKIKIFGVVVGLKEFRRKLAGAASDGDQVTRDNVYAARFH